MGGGNYSTVVSKGTEEQIGAWSPQSKNLKPFKMSSALWKCHSLALSVAELEPNVSGLFGNQAIWKAFFLSAYMSTCVRCPATYQTNVEVLDYWAHNYNRQLGFVLWMQASCRPPPPSPPKAFQTIPINTSDLTEMYRKSIIACLEPHCNLLYKFMRDFDTSKYRILSLKYVEW